MFARRTVRITIRSVIVAVVAVALAVCARWATGNTGAVVPGAIYRAGQPSGSSLTRFIRRHGIRTVLNLRGSNPDEPWYRAERAATLAAGARQVDVSLATDQWMSRVQLRAVIDLLEGARRPILIHCQWGAERTGLVAALATLLRPGGTLEQSRGQFSLRYLYLPTQDGLVMSGHIEAYADWLASSGQTHSPARFRHWALSVYRPGTPSREQWPYDPYPLVVVTYPGGSSPPHGRIALPAPEAEAAALRR